MVEFASTGLFIAFGFHICSLIMILFCFFMIFLDILFVTKAIFILIYMIVAISFTSSGEVLGFLFKYFCQFSIDTNSNWRTGKTKRIKNKKVSFLMSFSLQ